MVTDVSAHKRALRWCYVKGTCFRYIVSASHAHVCNNCGQLLRHAWRLALDCSVQMIVSVLSCSSYQVDTIKPKEYLIFEILGSARPGIILPCHPQPQIADIVVESEPECTKILHYFLYIFRFWGGKRLKSRVM